MKLAGVKVQLAMSTERFALLSLDLEVEVEVEVVVKEEADVAVEEDGLTAEATVAAAGFLAQSQAPGQSHVVRGSTALLFLSLATRSASSG